MNLLIVSISCMKSAMSHHTNRLALEKSPYLLQHAHNPVDWFAWNEEAFARARKENKPVFLSIGYSTCHWCHVMERESFEDEKIAAILNRHFVSIKVDREERPDVDKIYMTFVQATTGSGGWPLNVFLTPERKPFFGGTYYPPEDRSGRPGFPRLLQQLHEVWQTRRSEVAVSADDIHARLEAASAGMVPANAPLTMDLVRQAGSVFNAAYDPRHGGFGSAPKFPQPGIPSLLLHCASRFNDAEMVRRVLHTCERMAAGGIHDQLGGGFSRYSVDAEWLVPHFEKMLYDNAQLAQLYLDAHLVSKSKIQNPKSEMFADTVRDILDYVLRDMTHPGGGFYSAEDADSEGHEGKFYCWTRAELQKLLPPEEFKTAVRYFGITEQGNFADHSHPTPLPGQNVLSIVDPNLSDAEKLLFASAKKKMSDARKQRIRPHLDDKILASWNGLMLGAMARAYAVLGDEAYRVAAEKNVEFIREKLWEAPQGGLGSPRPVAGAHSAIDAPPTGTLFHRWRDGERDHVQLLEAYAFQLSGMIDLYEATLEPEHLDFASALAEALVARFYDAKNGGFWQSAGDTGDLILRVKDDYDGAEPSGNSVATLALLKLAAITGREDFREPAAATLRLFAHRLQNFPQALPVMMQAVEFWLEEPRRVVITGDPRAGQTRELLHAAHSVYQPNKIVLGNTGAVEAFARTLPAGDSPMVYVCTGQACQPPTPETAKLRELLS